jgi:uncharacterized alpha/beta hydrolase family protein
MASTAAKSIVIKTTPSLLLSGENQVGALWYKQVKISRHYLQKLKIKIRFANRMKISGRNKKRPAPIIFITGTGGIRL